MKYVKRVCAGPRVGAFTAATGVAVALSGCTGGRWFENGSQGGAPMVITNPAAPDDLETSAITYVRNLCTLPREQREPQVRELNELLLPHHVTISCGRAGTPGE
jgi:hypothetical protein